MKILLIHPPPAKKQDLLGGIKFPPLGITLLASILREKGYEISLFESYGLKAGFENIRKKIKKFQPDVIGITATSHIIYHAFRIAEIAKSINKNIKVVLGGVHPTVAPEHSLSNKNIDIIVKGEGEITFPDLLKVFEGKKNLEEVNGIGFIKDKKAFFTGPREVVKNLDELPIPAYDLLPKEAYRSPYSNRKPFMTMVRSRGCPYQCIYCEHHVLFSAKYRCQSPERAIREIDYLVNKFKVKEISFKDSEFTLAPRKNIYDFCDLLIERNYDLKWCVNGRANNVDKELLKKMKKAGCYSITYGLESGDQRILNNLKKGITLEQSEKAVKIAKGVGMQVVANFMVGNPGETKQSINRTIKFMKKLNLDYGYFGFLTAFPGTELRRMAEEKGWLLDPSMRAVQYEDLNMNATEIPTEELRKYLNKIYRAFYLRPSYILKRLTKLNLMDIRNNIAGFQAILKNTIDTLKR